ncbi:MAG: flavin monoamine oxidase family protein, partial [Acidimicrobiia bacterium]
MISAGARLDADTLATPHHGLGGAEGGPKRVIVIGAGLAGLVAGYELLRMGHDPLILEAQNRVGGRVFTLRDFAPGLYAEAGAMRIPRAHDLTLAYCEEFGLELRPFVMGNPKGLVQVGGVRMTAADADTRPELLPFQLADHERGRPCGAVWEEAIAPLREMLEQGGEGAWEEIVARYDHHSLVDFLAECGWSSGLVEYWAVMNFMEADLHTAVVEVLREELLGAYVDMSEIVGGMDRLPNAFYHRLRDHLRLGAEVHALDQEDDSVTVLVRTGAGRYAVTGDYAICTLPFSVLRT